MGYADDGSRIVEEDGDGVGKLARAELVAMAMSSGVGLGLFAEEGAADSLTGLTGRRRGEERWFLDSSFSFFIIEK